MSMWEMTARQLVEFERMGGENGTTSDLCTALANALNDTLNRLESCVIQVQEYSENELVIDYENKRTYPIEELKEFIKLETN